MYKQIQSVIINIIFILVRYMYDTSGLRTKEIINTIQEADRCISKPMHLITQRNALVILSRTRTVGFRFLTADVASTSVVASKYCILYMPTTVYVNLTVALFLKRSGRCHSKYFNTFCFVEGTS